MFSASSEFHQDTSAVCRSVALGSKTVNLSRALRDECNAALALLHQHIASNTLLQAIEPIETKTLPAISETFEKSILQLVAEDYPAVPGSLRLLADCFNLCRQTALEFLTDCLSKLPDDETTAIAQARTKLMDCKKSLDHYPYLFKQRCQGAEFRHYNFRLVDALEKLLSLVNTDYHYLFIYEASAYVDFLKDFLKQHFIITQALINSLLSSTIPLEQEHVSKITTQKRIFDVLFQITLPQIMTHWEPSRAGPYAQPSLYQDIFQVFQESEKAFKQFLMNPLVFQQICPETKQEDQQTKITTLLNSNRTLLQSAFMTAAKSAASPLFKRTIVNTANKLRPSSSKPTKMSKKPIEQSIPTSPLSNSVSHKEMGLEEPPLSANMSSSCQPSRLILLRDRAEELKKDLINACEENMAIFRDNPSKITQQLSIVHTKKILLPLIKTVFKKRLSQLVSEYHPTVPCSIEILTGCFNDCKQALTTVFGHYITVSQYGLPENPTLQKTLEEKLDLMLKKYSQSFQNHCKKVENNFIAHLQTDSCDDENAETEKHLPSSSNDPVASSTPPSTQISNVLTPATPESRIIDARKCHIISETELQTIKVKMIRHIKDLTQKIKNLSTPESINLLLETLTNLFKDDLTSLIAVYWCKSPTKQKTTTYECFRECLNYYKQAYPVIKKYLPNAPSPQFLETECLKIYEEAWRIKIFEYANFGNLFALEKFNFVVHNFNGKDPELLIPRTPDEYSANLKETLQLLKTRIQQLSQDGTLLEHQETVVSLLKQLPVTLCEIIEKWSTEHTSIPAHVGWEWGKLSLPIEVKSARHLALHKVVWDAFCEIEIFYRDLSMDPNSRCLQGVGNSMSPQQYWEQRAKEIASTLESSYRQQAQILQKMKKSRTTDYCASLAKEITQFADRLNSKKSLSFSLVTPTSNNQNSNKSALKKKQTTKRKRKKITQTSQAVTIPKATPTALIEEIVAPLTPMIVKPCLPIATTMIKIVEENKLIIEPIITFFIEDTIAEIKRVMILPTSPLIEPCSLVAASSTEITSCIENLISQSMAITADGISPRILDLLSYLGIANIVGGFPRHLFLKKLTDAPDETSRIATLKNIDIDFVTTASHEVIMSLPKIFPEIRQIKDRNAVKDGLYKLIFAIEGINISIDIMHKPTLELAEDARSRDFTVNALYISIDPHGQIVLHYPLIHSLDDLKQRIVRPANELSDIEQDPKRILRALRLVTQDNFVLENSLHDYIKEQGATLLRQALQKQPIPVMDAVWKGFQQGDAQRFYQILCEYHLFAVLFPEAYRLLAIEKNESFIEKLQTDLNYISQQSCQLRRRDWLFCDVFQLPPTSPPRTPLSPPVSAMNADSSFIPPMVPLIQPVIEFEQQFPQQYFHFFSPPPSYYQEPYAREFVAPETHYQLPHSKKFSGYDTGHTRRSPTQSHHPESSRRASRGGLFYGGSHAEPHLSQRSNSRYPARHPHPQKSSPSSHAAPTSATAPPPTPRTR